MNTIRFFLYRVVFSLVVALSLTACDRDSAAHDEHEHHAEESEHEPARGPHGGRILADGPFSLELAIFESGVPPEFHAWARHEDAAVDPAKVTLQVELTRLGGAVERFDFAPAGDFLRGSSEVHEPHSFDVQVVATHEGQTFRWTYDSYEGRTTIAADVAQSAGIETAVAGPGTILDEASLYGALVPDATRVREVRARYPGVIRAAHVRIGETVRAGDVLASVESNESLQTYSVTAPIAGVITQRHAEPGEQTSEASLFEIADFSRVWAELSIFPRDRARLREGQSARVTAEGGVTSQGKLDYLSPVGARGSQSVVGRVVLDNTDGRWTPGQFVEARITVAQTPVDIAVPLSALQSFRDFTVVFAQVGETYEVRMLELGKRDAERVEVLGGLAPDTRYVVRNSYLIKADIEKAGASHDH
jgi:membrane fusion protein, heavy metal efflux system